MLPHTTFTNSISLHIWSQTFYKAEQKKSKKKTTKAHDFIDDARELQAIPNMQVMFEFSVRSRNKKNCFWCNNQHQQQMLLAIFPHFFLPISIMIFKTGRCANYKVQHTTQTNFYKLQVLHFVSYNMQKIIDNPFKPVVGNFWTGMGSRVNCFPGLWCLHEIWAVTWDEIIHLCSFWTWYMWVVVPLLYGEWLMVCSSWVQGLHNGMGSNGLHSFGGG